MKLFFDRKAKDPIYYIQQGFRNGKKTSTRNVKRIGKHSELLQITDDPLTYAKEQVRLLNEEYKNGKVNLEVTIDFEEKVRALGDLASQSTARNIGYLFLQQIYKQLRIGSFVQEITKESKITFDANLVNRFLTFARILDPASKYRSCQQLQNFYEEPKIAYQHVLRFMDLLYPHFDAYIEHLFRASEKIVKRDTAVCYLDCTNFYFETECEDLDYVDEVTGEFIKGFRKYGVSKEHRPNPLVQMGLFMDRNGLPLTLCLNSGSDGETLCALPLEKKLLTMFEGKKFIYCSDAGLCSYDIRKFNSMGQRAFVVTQSLKKLSKELRKDVFLDKEYRLLSNDKPISIEALKSMDKTAPENKSLYLDKAYKVIPADQAVELGLYETKVYKNGNTRRVKAKAKMPQVLLVTFSRKVMEYQRYIRQRQIERALTILERNKQDPESQKKSPYDVKRFIKRTSMTKTGDEAIFDQYELNTEKIEEEAQFDGYFCIATDLDEDVRTILEINEQRYQIEDCFRLLKSSFDARPVFHRNEERIKTHFLLCFTALLIYRLLEKQLKENGTPFSPTQILDTLKNMNIVNVQDLYYMAAYTGSEVLTALNGLYDLKLNRKYYRPKEINSKI